MATMTDEEFKVLKKHIHRLMIDLAAYQKIHTAQTGRPYVIAGPLNAQEPEEDQIIVDGPFPSMEWVARMAGS